MTDLLDELQTKLEPRKGKVKWRPKKWRPEYDRIVAYSVLGRSNLWIAESLKFTPEHVSTILNLPEGKALQEKLHAKLREKIEVNVPDVLSQVAQKAAERVKAMLDDDALFAKSPFAVVDRGLDILKGVGHLRGGGNGATGQPALQAGNVTNIGTMIVTPGQKSDILEGLQKIAEVKALHGSSTGDRPQK